MARGLLAGGGKDGVAIVGRSGRHQHRRQLLEAARHGEHQRDDDQALDQLPVLEGRFQHLLQPEQRDGADDGPRMELMPPSTTITSTLAERCQPSICGATKPNCAAEKKPATAAIMAEITKAVSLMRKTGKPSERALRSFSFAAASARPNGERTSAWTSSAARTSAASATK